MGSKVARFRIGRPLTRPAGSSPAPSTIPMKWKGPRVSHRAARQTYWVALER